MPSKRRLHTGETGFLTAWQNPGTGLNIVVYDSKDAGFSSDHQKYTLYCAAHGATCCETNLRRAKSLMRTPKFWCNECNELADDDAHQALRVVPYDLKSPEERERELRVMAQMIRGDVEKAALFETVYGVKPDRFWDPEG
jgi:hypothetical protein